MAENSDIEWTDHTWNGWIGCTKISPGCDNCYAATQDKFRRWTPAGWGRERRRTSEGNWHKPHAWNKQPYWQCQCGWRGTQREMVPWDDGFGAWASCPRCHLGAFSATRARVFCASLSDWLDNEVPVKWRVDLLRTIFHTPALDWLLLSKRIGNFSTMLNQVRREVDFQAERDFWLWLKAWERGEEAPNNVWVGATIINQVEADRDVPKLLSVLARVRFLSMEPLLSDVRLRPCWMSVGCGFGNDDDPATSACLPCGTSGCERCAWPSTRIDWVIVGGESGPNARPMSPQWAQSVRDQCLAAGVAFIFKQWGAWIPMLGQAEGIPVRKKITTPDGWIVGLAGKKGAGRRLDGVVHHGFPAVSGA